VEFESAERIAIVVRAGWHGRILLPGWQYKPSGNLRSDERFMVMDAPPGVQVPPASNVQVALELDDPAELTKRLLHGVMSGGLRRLGMGSGQVRVGKRKGPASGRTPTCG